MRKQGALAWIGLSLYVVAYDTWAITRDTETLSAAFGRALAHRHARWLVLAVWGFTTLHLLGRLPAWADPFRGYAHLVGHGDRPEIDLRRVLALPAR